MFNDEQLATAKKQSGQAKNDLEKAAVKLEHAASNLMASGPYSWCDMRAAMIRDARDKARAAIDMIDAMTKIVDEGRDPR